MIIIYHKVLSAKNKTLLTLKSPKHSSIDNSYFKVTISELIQIFHNFLSSQSNINKSVDGWRPHILPATLMNMNTPLLFSVVLTLSVLLGSQSGVTGRNMMELTGRNMMGLTRRNMMELTRGNNEGLTPEQIGLIYFVYGLGIER